MDNNTKLIRWLKESIISKKSMISTTVYTRTDMPFWQFLLWIVPFAILAVFILKVIGTVWKNNGKQQSQPFLHYLSRSQSIFIELCLKRE